MMAGTIQHTHATPLHFNPRTCRYEAVTNAGCQCFCTPMEVSALAASFCDHSGEEWGREQLGRPYTFDDGWEDALEFLALLWGVPGPDQATREALL